MKINLKTLFLIALVAGFWHSAYSLDRAQLDSLLNRLEEDLHTAERLKTLNKLCREYQGVHLDSSKLYGSLALAESELLGDPLQAAITHNNVGVMYAMRSEYEEATRQFMLAVEYYESTNDRPRLAGLYGNIGSLHELQGNLEQAMFYHNKTIGICLILEDSARLANTYHNISNAEVNEGKLAEAVDHLRSAVELNLALGRSLQLVKNYSSLADAYLDLGQMDLARIALSNAERHVIPLEKPRLQAIVHLAQGNLAKGSHSYVEAIEFYNLAREQYKKAEEMAGEGRVLTSLGLVCTSIGQFESAEQYFRDALVLADNTNDQKLKSRVLTNLGTALSRLERYAEAEACYRQSIAIKETLNSPGELTVVYLQLGELERNQGRFEQSLNTLNLALQQGREWGMLKHEPNILLAMARDHHALGQSSLALDHINQAREMALERNQSEVATTSLLDLAAVNHDLGNDSLAIVAYRQYIAEHDSVFSFAVSDRAGQLAAQYWSEKKQHALDLAEKDKALLEQSAEAERLEKDKIGLQRNFSIAGGLLLLILAIAVYRVNLKRKKDSMKQQVSDLELKALRAQINPHFLFNALNGVQGLINKNELRSANLFLSKCAKLTRGILEQSDHETVSLETELHTLDLYIQLEAMRFSFDYNVKVADDFDPEIVQVPSMLMQPFVENAILHGLSKKADHKHLQIDVLPHEQGLMYVIEDNGVGRPAEHQTREASHRPMGMRITHDRITKLHEDKEEGAHVAVIDLKDEAGQPRGTRVEIVLPLLTADS